MKYCNDGKSYTAFKSLKTAMNVRRFDKYNHNIDLLKVEHPMLSNLWGGNALTTFLERYIGKRSYRRDVDDSLYTDKLVKNELCEKYLLDDNDIRSCMPNDFILVSDEEFERDYAHILKSEKHKDTTRAQRKRELRNMGYVFSEAEEEIAKQKNKLYNEYLDMVEQFEEFSMMIDFSEYELERLREAREKLLDKISDKVKEFDEYTEENPVEN